MGAELPCPGCGFKKRLDTDPQLLLELTVGKEYGRSHSEFLAWSAVDRDKAIWLFLRERETCRYCGTRPDEWDPEHGGHRQAYVGRIVTCAGCVVRERTEDSSDMQGGRGKKVELHRNPIEGGPV